MTTFSQPATLWFDPQCRANDANLSAAIKAFGRFLAVEEGRLGVRFRSRTVMAKRGFDLAVETICCNLLFARMIGPTAALAVPLDNNVLWGNGRYANPVYGQHFRDVIKLLARLGMIELTAGYRFSSRSKAPTLATITDNLNKHLPFDGRVHWNWFRRESDKELLVLKSGKDEDGKSKLVNYRETANTRRWRAQVARINKWLSCAEIDVLPGPGVIGDDGFPIALYRRSLHRTFNNGSWQEGGRLWGGFWMSMKRAERFERIRINGEPIADVDYEQLYPRLAYARAQSELPEDDFYDIAGDGSCRGGWKILINAMLFAEKQLGNWPKGAKSHFPEDMSLRAAVEMIKRKHSPIAHLFGSGLGFQLMRIESDILIAVITHLFKNGIPALPLHDAVLVGASQHRLAKEAMEEELGLRTGCRRACVKVDFGFD